MAVSGGILIVVTGKGGSAGTQWIEGRGAAKHAAAHSTAPPTKGYPTDNASSAEGEKPYLCTWYVANVITGSHANI